MTDFRNVGPDATKLAAIQDMVGYDDANNSQASTLTAANADGSVMERLEYIQTTAADRALVGAKTAVSATAVMVNGDTLFTVAGGPIRILALASICISSNDATASTLQYSVTPTVGSAQTISGASASLANAAAGASVTLAGTALATAALYNANGPNLMANPGTILAPAGTIKAVIGTGSTTGTWKHYLRYEPLTTGVTVS